MSPAVSFIAPDTMRVADSTHIRHNRMPSFLIVAPGLFLGVACVSSCLDLNLVAPTWDGSACSGVLQGTAEVIERTLVVAGAGQFPVLVRSQDTLLLLFRGRGGHLDVTGRLDLMRSVDEGRSWEGREIVVDSPLDDRNGATGIGRDKQIIVGYAIYDAYGAGGSYLGTPRSMYTFVVRSADGGATWSQPQRVDQSPYQMMSPYGRIAALPDGHLLMSVYVGGGVPGQWAAAYVESADGGKTWTRPHLINAHHNETSILIMSNDVWLAAMRNENNTGITLVRSIDRGKTWDPYRLVTLADEVPGDLIALNDSTVWLTYGHRRSPYGIRGRLSADWGESWSPPVVLASDGLNQDVGYPSSAVLPSGDVLTAYYEEASIEYPEDGRHAAVLRYNPLSLACSTSSTRY